MSPRLRTLSTSCKSRYQPQSLLRSRKKSGELCPLTTEFGRLMFTHPQWTLRVMCRPMQLHSPGGVRRSKISTPEIFPSRTYGAGRPHVELCSILLVFLFLTPLVRNILLLIFTAACYSNGAVLPSSGVCPSVCPSLCNVGGLWSRTLSSVSWLAVRKFSAI